MADLVKRSTKFLLLGLFATSASSVLLTTLLIEIPYLRARSLNSLGTLAETTTDMGLPLTYYDISITEREFFLPCMGFIAPPQGYHPRVSGGKTTRSSSFVLPWYSSSEMELSEGDAAEVPGDVGPGSLPDRTRATDRLTYLAYG